MKKPKLQIALDSNSLEDAFTTLSSGLDQIVDIIEVGTYLIMMDGIRAVSILRSAYPGKIIAADAMVIAPQFGEKMLEQGPDFVTINSTAEDDCITKVMAAAEKSGLKCQIQLYGENWTHKDLIRFRNLGIEYIIYDRYGSGPWGDRELKILNALYAEGFFVTAAGGITYEDLDVLSSVPLYAIICGKSVRNAADPAAEALRLKTRCRMLWENQ